MTEAVQQDPVKTLEQQRLLLKRTMKAQQARDGLIAFTEMTLPDAADPNDPDKSAYDAQKHHRAIAAVLEEVAKGTIPRLILTMPPRHGKSELVSRRLPAWILGRDPYKNIIFATYNEEFAEDFGREVRSIMSSPAYKQIFPGTTFRKGGASAGRLQTTRGGMAAFVGRGGSITGRGADVLILDDLIKDAIEASSPTLRQQVWEWLTKVAFTRLSSNVAVVVVVMTRWHEDDPVGRLTDPTNPNYNAVEASKWKIIDLPAIAEDDDPLGRDPGEVLWPGKFDLPFLEAQRRLDPLGFSALYQQRPTVEDGDHFKREYIQYYKPEQLPKDLRIYAASDHAVGLDKMRNDCSVFLIAGLDRQQNIYLLDCWWRRADTGTSVEAMIDLMERWKPLIWWAEKGHISKSIGPFLRKRMLERETFANIIEVTPTGNKEARAQSIQGRMSMGMVYFPKHAEWSLRAIDELMKFPNGRHDDFVDAIAYIGLGLQQQVGAAGPRQTKPVPKTGTLAWIKWDSKYRDQQRDIEEGIW